ncbi:MAG: sigma-70 family RNA polymerase sigma factor [Acidobacteria bacterium]|nr:sigma-70 family RNA polymerase sigma factor [Acidobacteriota bacterium]
MSATLESVSSPSGNAPDDRALVARFLRARDEASFRALYRAHSPRLLLFARRLLGGEQDAEDTLQETWMRAVRRLESFRWESSLRTWLCAIVLNCCREARRHRRPQADPESVRQFPAPAGLGPAEAAQLEALVRTLPDGYREVLVLHDLEGYTHEEISGLLGIAEGTSKSQLFRARQTLRGWLNPSSIVDRRNP